MDRDSALIKASVADLRRDTLRLIKKVSLMEVCIWASMFFHFFFMSVIILVILIKGE